MVQVVSELGVVRVLKIPIPTADKKIFQPSWEYGVGQVKLGDGCLGLVLGWFSHYTQSSASNHT